jgi:putative DNA primase/helicase
MSPAAELLAAALLYARLGWFVFPVYEVRPGPRTPLDCTCPPWSKTRKAGVCGNAGKHPRTRSGLNDATRDLVTIHAWWHRWPRANVGIATGPSGLVVVDVDPRNDGDESLRALEAEHGALPLTPLALTGGGGWHHVLARPDDMARVPTFSPAQGIDVKADGGFIVGAPSLHYSGRYYAWDLTASPEDTPRAAVTAWLRTRIEAEVAKHTGARGPVTGVVTDGLLGMGVSARRVARCRPRPGEERRAVSVGRPAYKRDGARRVDGHFRAVRRAHRVVAL